MTKKKPSPDELVGRHAARHHGLVSRSVALRLGLSDRQIAGRVRKGRWERVAQGVYRIAGAPVTPTQQLFAAVLAAGPGAAAAGLSSLALVGVGSPPLLPRITVPPTASARTRNAIVRRSPVGAADLTRVGPIRCTTPSRALLEAAAQVEPVRLEELVDDVLCEGRTTPSRIVGSLRRATMGHGREGAAALRAAVEPWLRGVAPDSPAEMRLLRRIRDWGLPEPVRQHEVDLDAGRRARLDLAWPADLVGLEYDGERAHGPRRLEPDDEREAALRRQGWWIGRVDRHDLAPSSTRVRDELAARLPRPAA